MGTHTQTLPGREPPVRSGRSQAGAGKFEIGSSLMDARRGADPHIFRKIDYLVVINPPGMGRRRKKKFVRHLSNFRGRLPPVKYIGVNANYLDMRNFEGSSRLRDKRSPFVRLKLKMGWEKNAIDFASRYGAYFEPPPDGNPKWRAGMAGCTLSHFEAWRFIASLDDGDRRGGGGVLVVEDDMLIDPGKNLDEIQVPCEEADFLWLRGLLNYKNFDERFCIIDNEAYNYSTSLYFITPRGARQLLECLMPLSLLKHVDITILRSPTLKIFGMRPEQNDYVWKTTGELIGLIDGVRWHLVLPMFTTKLRIMIKNLRGRF